MCSFYKEILRSLLLYFSHIQKQHCYITQPLRFARISRFLTSDLLIIDLTPNLEKSLALPRFEVKPGEIVKCSVASVVGIEKAYLAVILEQDDERQVAKVSFLKRSSNSNLVYMFPSNEEITWEPFKSISHILEQPSFSRGRFIFAKDPIE